MSPTTSTPPATPIRWAVYCGDGLVNVYLGEVVAQFWIEARALASAKFSEYEAAALTVEPAEEAK